MGNLSHDIRDHFYFKFDEAVKILILALPAAFAVTFRMWGEGSVVDVAFGLSNLFQICTEC